MINDSIGAKSMNDIKKLEASLKELVTIEKRLTKMTDIRHDNYDEMMKHIGDIKCNLNREINRRK